MNTHISYKTAKRIKEFLGNYAPEPIGEDSYFYDNDECRHTRINLRDNISRKLKSPSTLYPAYQLHDLLSKPFCEAITIKVQLFATMVGNRIYSAYYSGGLPAVEKALIEIMGNK